VSFKKCRDAGADLHHKELKMRSEIKSSLLMLSVILTSVSLIFVAHTYGQAQLDPVIYIPIVRTSDDTPTPTATALPTNTPLPTATLPPSVTPTVTPGINLCDLDPNPASAPNSPLLIDDIDKAAQIVSLKNVSGTSVNLTGWHMCSINGNQEHTGLNGVLAPGQIRSFPYSGSGTIWNNTQRDDGALYNAAGQLVAYDENID
jgi:hypothetical protein